MYRLYDSVNGEWVNGQLFTREEAEAYLMRHQNDRAFQDGDIHFATVNDSDYDGDLIELGDLINPD